MEIKKKGSYGKSDKIYSKNYPEKVGTGKFFLRKSFHLKRQIGRLLGVISSLDGESLRHVISFDTPRFDVFFLASNF